MQAAPRCADCDVPMVEGFIPDNTYRVVLQNHWHAGPPRKATFFGLDVGVTVTHFQMMPIICFRCAECGLLKSYAFPRKRKK